uniref:Rhodopsin domain-containing protein n=1 Tax=Bionectria ochroleuca TaxID=29856 RepID=A0A8H7KEG8_BIOOC
MSRRARYCGRRRLFALASCHLDYQKMAVVYLLTKLLNPNKWHKYFLWWQGIWCQLTLFATVGVLIGRCKPAHSLWNFDVPGECFSPDILVAYCIYAGSFSAFVDLYLAIYPAVVLFNLQMSFKKKLALSFALGIGSVSGIVAIYKTTRIPSLKSADFSYDTADLVAWTVIEGSTIIVASTIPILQPLVEKVLRRNPFSSGKDSAKYNGRYYEDYSDQKSGYELGQRKPKSKARDDLGLTVLEEGGSQEEILSGTKPNVVAAGTAKPIVVPELRVMLSLGLM